MACAGLPPAVVGAGASAGVAAVVDAVAVAAMTYCEESYARHVHTILLFQSIVRGSSRNETTQVKAADAVGALQLPTLSSVVSGSGSGSARYNATVSRALFGLGSYNSSWASWLVTVKPLLTFALRPNSVAALNVTGGSKPKLLKAKSNTTASTAVADVKSPASDAIPHSRGANFDLEPVTSAPPRSAASHAADALSVAVTQNPNGYGELGTRVFDCALVLTRYLETGAVDFSGKRVVELGAGTGLPAIFVAKYFGAELHADGVWATDRSTLVPLLTHNARLNLSSASSSRPHVHALEWINPAAPPADATSADGGDVAAAALAARGGDAGTAAAVASASVLDAPLDPSDAKFANATAEQQRLWVLPRATERTFAAIDAAAAAASGGGETAAASTASGTVAAAASTHHTQALPSVIAKCAPFDVVLCSDVTSDAADDLPKVVATLLALTAAPASASSSAAAASSSSSPPLVVCAYERESALTPLWRHLMSHYFDAVDVPSGVLDVSDCIGNGGCVDTAAAAAAEDAAQLGSAAGAGVSVIDPPVCITLFTRARSL